MLAYTTLGASDLEAAVEFYGALTETMGWKKIMGTDRIVFFGTSMSETCLAVCTPYDEQAPRRAMASWSRFMGAARKASMRFTPKQFRSVPPVMANRVSASLMCSTAPT